MTAPAIEVKNLAVTMDGSPILSEVSFAVRPGEALAIIGPNGAGKTTLLRSLMRMVRPASGEISVFGEPLARLSQRDLARRVSYVPQAGERAMPFTVREFMLMARYPHLGAFSGFSTRDYEITDQAMERSGVAVFSTRSMGTLSGGERQKVYIAAALAQEPRVMLLDEPTTFLDYRHQVEVLELVDQLHRTGGLTVVSVTHDLNQGALAGDRVLALKAGRTAFDGTPAELLDRPEVLAGIYDTEFDLIPHPHNGTTIVAPIVGRP